MRQDAGMGRRREVLEDAALRLCEELGPAGADLRHAIPAGTVQDDAHVPALVIRLRRIVDGPWAAPAERAEAARLMHVAADLTTAPAPCGEVWMVWSEPSPHDLAPELADPPHYDCVWSDEDYCGSARFTTLDEALAWARRRSESIIVAPSWDPGVHYWAGAGAAPPRLAALPPEGRRVPPAPTIEPAQRSRDPEPYVPEDPLRITGTPYRPAASPSMSWPEAVQMTDQVLLNAVIDRGEDQASQLERTLRWLNDGLSPDPPSEHALIKAAGS
jgi:hypothetical protein